MPFLAAAVTDLPWQTLLSSGLYLLAYLGGLIFAIMTWRKHATVSLVVTVVMGTLICRTCWMLWANEELRQRVRDMPMEEAMWEYWLISVPYIAALIVLAFAALLKRGPAEPGIISGEEAPHV